jgi:hypothetical protein
MRWTFTDCDKFIDHVHLTVCEEWHGNALPGLDIHGWFLQSEEDLFRLKHFFEGVQGVTVKPGNSYFRLPEVNQGSVCLEASSDEIPLVILDDFLQRDVCVRLARAGMIRDVIVCRSVRINHPDGPSMRYSKVIVHFASVALAHVFVAMYAGGVEVNLAVRNVSSPSRLDSSGY